MDLLESYETRCKSFSDYKTVTALRSKCMSWKIRQFRIQASGGQTACITQKIFRSNDFSRLTARQKATTQSWRSGSGKSPLQYTDARGLKQTSKVKMLWKFAFLHQHSDRIFQIPRQRLRLRLGAPLHRWRGGRLSRANFRATFQHQQYLLFSHSPAYFSWDFPDRSGWLPPHPMYQQFALDSICQIRHLKWMW